MAFIKSDIYYNLLCKITNLQPFPEGAILQETESHQNLIVPSGLYVNDDVQLLGKTYS